jgi:DHA2 family multidrug resistance protein
LRPDQNNRASSITSFFRNWGGSFRIALVTTMSERRQDFHQTTIGAASPGTSAALQDAVRQTAAYLQWHGFSHADVASAATLHYYQHLQKQARLLAFMDCFHVLGVITLLAAPLVLLTRNFRASSRGGAAH